MAKGYSTGIPNAGFRENEAGTGIGLARFIRFKKIIIGLL